MRDQTESGYGTGGCIYPQKSGRRDNIDRDRQQQCATLQMLLTGKIKIDVMILCGGSAMHLPVQTPEYAKMFNVIDSFDTHAKIPVTLCKRRRSCKKGGHIGIISVGWDECSH